MLIDVSFHGFSEFDLVSFGSIFNRVGNTIELISLGHIHEFHLWVVLCLSNHRK